MTTIIVIAIIMRIPALTFGIPQAIHPDDAYVLVPAAQLAEHFTSNPHKFGLPDSTLFYTQAASLRIGFFLAHKLQLSDASTILQAYQTQEPWIYIIARSWNIGYVVGILILVDFIARTIFASRRAGIIATSLVAISAILIEHTAYIRPDIPLAWWSLVVLASALAYYHNGRTRYLIIAGIATGLATATKYPGILTCAPIIAAYILRDFTWRPRRIFTTLFSPDIMATAAIAVITFFIATPHALHSPVQLITDIIYEGRSRHPGADGLSAIQNLLFYFRTTFNWGIGTSASIVALISATLICIKKPRTPTALILYIFPLIFLAALSLHPLHWSRWMIPVLPYIAISAGVGIDRLLKKWPRVGAALVLIVFIPIIIRATITTTSLTRPESRVVAATWIDQHIPADNTIVRDAYAPQLDATRWHIINYDTIAEKNLSQYKKQGVTYLIESSDQRDKITSGTTSKFLEQHQRDIDTKTTKISCTPTTRDQLAPHITEISDITLLKKIFGTPKNTISEITQITKVMRGAQICIYQMK